MPRRKIYITQIDLQRLCRVVASELDLNDGSNRRLTELIAELERAEVVLSDEIPDNVVTMNSTVVLRDLDTGESETYTLVYPNHANIARNRLSVLAPVGTAILGYQVGDVVRWRVPAGVRRLRVEEVVFQPERVGAFDL
ncbi:MAG: nucleoside diphosphate kinase regulator [Pirellulaceae bacterium]|jgi:regulator of nucleoside diphosphate kinase|nr:nucleoside diphosphate kinase regulator [Pirellulaceae bacterium]